MKNKTFTRIKQTFCSLLTALFLRKFFAQLPLVVFLFFCLFFSSLDKVAYGFNSQKATVFVVYDSKTRFGEHFPIVDSLAEFLGHFNFNKKVISVDEWKKGMLTGAEAVVFVGLKDDPLPQDFLQEVAGVAKIIWFEKNIEQLANYLKWQDFRYEGLQNGWTAIASEKEYYIGSWMDFVATKPGSKAKTFASVKNDFAAIPLGWQRGNVYYFSKLEFIAPPFNNLLARFFYTWVADSYDKSYSHPRNILLKIEGITPFSDPHNLALLVDEATRYNVPVALVVTPVEVNNNAIVRLSDKPELLKVLQNAQSYGASIVMNGYSGKNNFANKNGISYEFWNAADDKPLNDEDKFIKDRLDASFTEFSFNNLHPIAFQSPNFAMSKNGYKILSNYFNVLLGQVQISDKSSKMLLGFPYIIKSDYANNMIVVPENLGYYDGKDSSIEQIFQKAKDLKVIKDSFGSVFYHAYMPKEQLGYIIDGLKKQGYTFFDLRSLPIRVNSEQIKIVSKGDRHLSVDINEQSIQKRKDEIEKNKGYLMGDIGTIHIAILAIIIASFVYIIIKLQKMANRKYED